MMNRLALRAVTASLRGPAAAGKCLEGSVVLAKKVDPRACVLSVRTAPSNWTAFRGLSSAAQDEKSFISVTNTASTFDPRLFFDENQGTEGINKLRRALLYRSRQTGWLETDVIMGKWAEQNLEKLSLQELREYCDIVKSEIMDIFKWITGQVPVPEHLQSGVMRSLQDYAQRKTE